MKSLFPRRPTASLVISVVALFVALGGSGYAALSMPPNSVGTRQLRNSSVSNPKIRNLAVNFSKIAYGTVGIRRINIDQVQARVYGRCSGITGAIGSIDNAGHVTCNSTLPPELGANNPSTPVGTTATTLTSKQLPAGPDYLLIANPYATITSATAGQQVKVTCTLGAAGQTQARTVSVEIGSSHQTLEQAIPLVMPVPAQTGTSTASLSCSQASTPAAPVATVTMASTLNAIETGSDS
jgi:hypothetical protein